jgi:hypothetical protein
MGPAELQGREMVLERNLFLEGDRSLGPALRVFSSHDFEQPPLGLLPAVRHLSSKCPSSSRLIAFVDCCHWRPRDDSNVRPTV